MSQPNFQFGPPAGIGAGMPTQSVQPAAPQGQPVNDPTRVTVGPVVISYPNLFIPRRKDAKDPNSPMTYSAEFLIYHDNPKGQQLINQLMAAADIVCQEKFKRSIHTMEKKPVRDLAVRQSDKPGFFFSANSSNKPTVLAGNPPMPVTDSEVVYAGSLVYVAVKAAAYENNGNRGIKFFLNSVWKVADGTPLVAKRDALADFQGVMGEVGQYAAAPVQAAPQAYYPPQPQMAQVPPMPGQPPMAYGMPPGYPPAAYGQPQMPGYPQQ